MILCYDDLLVILLTDVSEYSITNIFNSDICKYYIIKKNIVLLILMSLNIEDQNNF
jgi:hypothetical protein